MKNIKKLRQCFLLVGSIFASLILCLNTISTPVFAEPLNNSNQSTSLNNSSETTNSSLDNSSTANNSITASENIVDNSSRTNGSSSSEGEYDVLDNSSSDSSSVSTCYDESGSLGWLVCPSTGFLAKITDSLYNIIEQFLIIKPISFDDSSPYHQVWSIFRDITNIIFVIFFLIVIYSQITGAGISNYGIKRVLPKIIISAILINLSYIICALAVDLSNIIGASLRGLFLGIEESVTATGIISEAATASSGISYTALAGALTGSAVLAGVAIGVAGGLGYVFFSLLAVLIAAAASILIA